MMIIRLYNGFATIRVLNHCFLFPCHPCYCLYKLSLWIQHVCSDGEGNSRATRIPYHARVPTWRRSACYGATIACSWVGVMVEVQREKKSSGRLCQTYTKHMSIHKDKYHIQLQASNWTLNLHMVLWLPQSTQFNQRDAMIFIYSKKKQLKISTFPSRVKDETMRSAAKCWRWLQVMAKVETGRMDGDMSIS